MFKSYVDYSDVVDEPLDKIEWFVNNCQVDSAKVQKEKDEENQQKRYQMQKGIIPAYILDIVSDEKIRCNVTPPILSKYKGINLFDECPCGSGNLIKDCCVKILLQKKM